MIPIGICEDSSRTPSDNLRTSPGILLEISTGIIKGTASEVHPENPARIPLEPLSGVSVVSFVVYFLTNFFGISSKGTLRIFLEIYYFSRNISWKLYCYSIGNFAIDLSDFSRIFFFRYCSLNSGISLGFL